MCLSQETDFRVFVENLLPSCCHTGNEQENGWNDCHPHILLFFILNKITVPKMSAIEASIWLPTPNRV